MYVLCLPVSAELFEEALLPIESYGIRHVRDFEKVIGDILIELCVRRYGRRPTCLDFHRNTSDKGTIRRPDLIFNFAHRGEAVAFKLKYGGQLVQYDDS